MVSHDKFTPALPTSTRPAVVTTYRVSGQSVHSVSVSFDSPSTRVYDRRLVLQPATIVDAQLEVFTTAPGLARRHPDGVDVDQHVVREYVGAVNGL